MLSCLDDQCMAGDDPFSWICDEIVEHIFSYVDEPSDRGAVSEVCKRWYYLESVTRRNITIGFSYAVSPSSLCQRFKNLVSFKIKGKPRVSEFGLVVKDWGGYSWPWIRELVHARQTAGAFGRLSSFHFRRMEVSDSDLNLLAHGFHTSLEILKLDKCTGFSTTGLLSIARTCRRLRVLYLEESVIEDRGSEWLQELGRVNQNLEVLNLFLTGLDLGALTDLEAIVNNCKSLRCLRLHEISIPSSELFPKDIFTSAKCLRELAILFGGAAHHNNSITINMPRTLTSLAGEIFFPLDRGMMSNLIEMDLMSSSLNSEQHIQVIQHCPNLQVLKVRNIIGDAGVETIANSCPKLKRIRIENLEDMHGFFSYRSLIQLATRCVLLEHVAIYVSEITNSALEAFGNSCPNMLDFRLSLLESGLPMKDVPLDTGVSALLRGCRKISRLAIYLQKGGLTDAGMAEIGKFGENLRWLLLGCVGNSDHGFLQLAAGCRSLCKLELRDCPLTEIGIVTGVRLLKSLRFLWIQKYNEANPYDLLNMGEWVVEYIVSGDENMPSQIVAYRSVVGPRGDFPPQVIPLNQVVSYVPEAVVCL